jgi:hypothetical protein
MSTATVYCFDTSAFVDAYTRRLQPQVFKTFWTKLDELIDAGRIVAPKQVLEELEVIHDDLFQWAKARGRIFVQQDTYQHVEVKNIAIRFAALSTQDPRKNYADPFVVALARVRGCIVVAQELRGSEQDPKIPYICAHYRMPCITLFDMMVAESWEF